MHVKTMSEAKVGDTFEVPVTLNGKPFGVTTWKKLGIGNYLCLDGPPIPPDFTGELKGFFSDEPLKKPNLSISVFP